MSWFDCTHSPTYTLRVGLILALGHMTISRAVQVVFLAFLATGCAAISQEADPDPRDEVIHNMLGHFWGNARDIKGRPIQPASEQERTRVPVSTPVAYRALEAGEVSGTAEWCGLEWEPHYFALTKSARSQGMSDAQVAFVSVLHGFAQGSFASSVAGTTCNSLTKERAQARLRDSAELGLPH